MATPSGWAVPTADAPVPLAATGVTVKPAAEPVIEAMGGPIVSSSVAAAGTRTRCRSMRDTRAPAAERTRTDAAYACGGAPAGPTRTTSSSGGPGATVCGAANASNRRPHRGSAAVGHADSTSPPLTPSTRNRWMSFVPRGSVTGADVPLTVPAPTRVKGRRSGSAANRARSSTSRAASVCDGLGSGIPWCARKVASEVV